MIAYIFRDKFKGIKDGIIKNTLKPKDATEFISLIVRGEINSSSSEKLKDTMTFCTDLDSTDNDVIAVVDFGTTKDTKKDLFGNPKDITFLPLFMAYTDDDNVRHSYVFASKKIYLLFNGFKLECNSNLNLLYEAMKKIDKYESFDIMFGNPDNSEDSISLYRHPGHRDPSKSFAIKRVDKELEGYFVNTSMINI